MQAAISLTSGMRQNLFSIQRTSKLLSANATRLNTGKKINSALDNPVAFFTALEHTNRAKDLMMRKAEMGEGIQTIRAASTGIDSMLELIDSAEALAKSALSAGSSEEVETLANQYNETLNQITAVSCDASYKGIGLLRCPPESMTINFDEAGGSSLTVEGECSSATGLGLSEVSSESATFEVTTADHASQQSLKAAPLSNGHFALSYSDSADGTFVQLISDAGDPIGTEIQVSEEGNTAPSVSELQNGGFVVTWHSDDYSNLLAQIFDENGNKIGSEISIVSGSSEDIRRPEIASLSDGSFVVSWWTGATDDYDIYARHYDIDGNPVGSEFQVNTSETGKETYPRLAALSDGGFIITWMGGSPSDYDIRAQIYDVNANPIGTEFQINSTSVGNHKFSDVAGLPDGGFVVTWGFENVGSQDGVSFQIFDSNGNTVGDEVQVSNTTPYDPFPSIDSFSDGSFIISWNTGSYRPAYTQKFDQDGNRVGEENLVSDLIMDGFTSVSVLSDDSYVVPYDSYSTTPADRNAYFMLLGSEDSIWSGGSNIQSSLDELQAAKERLRNLQQKFSNNLNIITTRSSFTDSMVNTLETGAGNLTNADMNEEGANALMLQTQQSLGMTSLSMASQAAQSVLRLFS